MTGVQTCALPISIGGGEKTSKRILKSPKSSKNLPSKPAETPSCATRLDEEDRGTTAPVANHPVLVLRPKSGKAKTVKGVKSKLSQKSAVAASDVCERRDRSAEQDETEKPQGECFYLYTDKYETGFSICFHKFCPTLSCLFHDGWWFYSILQCR